ncbi:MAG: hypothetical protein OK455_01090 [Thaumarchaeota archaeon]|nr:hypothetical protein [Nitrososphaerota archaeon]
MNNKNLYGVVAILLAGLIISSSVGAYYYYQYGQESQNASKYATEEASGTFQYNQLATQYNAALSLYNQTLSLLAGTTGSMNTSLPSYEQASSQLPGLWSSYLKLKPQSAHVYAADIFVDFANGTSRWFNNTQVQPGWNLYTATLVLPGSNVGATWYPSFSPPEHLVNSIFGVADSKTSYWSIWTFNQTASWQSAQVGADLLPVYNGSIFAWTFCAETATTCKP